MMVSVVIPAYNVEDTIAEALASVAAQTFRDFEVIVVDDASTDRTLERVETARGMLERLHVLKLERNGGPARARNAGIAAASGEWLAFLDGDDVWLPERLEFQMSVLKERPELALICSTASEFEDCSSPPPLARHRAVGAGVPMRTLQLDDFRIVNPVATSTVLVRKGVVERAGGFDESLRGPEDFDLWMRIAAAHPVARLECPLSYYRQRRGSLSTDDRRFLPAIMRLIDKAYGPHGVLRGRGPKKRAQGYHLLSCAWMAANRGATARAVVLFVRSLLYWPFSFRPAIRLPWGRSKVLLFIMRRMLRPSGTAAAVTFPGIEQNDP